MRASISRNGAPIFALPPFAGKIASLVVDHHLLCTSVNYEEGHREVILWNVFSGQKIGAVKGVFIPAAMARGDNILYTAERVFRQIRRSKTGKVLKKYRKAILARDMRTGKVLKYFKPVTPAFVSQLIAKPGLLVGKRRKQVIVWDGHTGKRLSRLHVGSEGNLRIALGRGDVLYCLSQGIVHRYLAPNPPVTFHEEALNFQDLPDSASLKADRKEPERKQTVAVVGPSTREAPSSVAGNPTWR